MCGLASVACSRGLYWKLTGRENLGHFGALYQLHPTARRRRADQIIPLLHLSDICERLVEVAMIISTALALVMPVVGYHLLSLQPIRSSNMAALGTTIERQPGLS